jgi:hypothetical protein
MEMTQHERMNASATDLIGRETPFRHAADLKRALREHAGRLIRHAEGRRWMADASNWLKAVLGAQVEVLRNKDSIKVPAMGAVPQPDSAGDWIPLRGLLMWLRLYLALWQACDREPILEETRRFFAWLQRFLALHGKVQETVSDDYAQLQDELNRIAEELRRNGRSSLKLEPASIEINMESEVWQVPVFRKLWSLFPRERITSAALVEAATLLIRRPHAEGFSALIEQINISLGETQNFLTSVRVYLKSDTENEEEFLQKYSARADQLIGRFVAEADAARKEKRAAIGRGVAAIYEAFKELETQPWFRIRRRFVVRGYFRLNDQLKQLEIRYQAIRRDAEYRLNTWLNEELKPAMGLAQVVKIRVVKNGLPSAWIETPALPPSLSGIFRDRDNPALLLPPRPVLKTMQLAREAYDQSHGTDFLFLTDNMSGGFGLVNYSLSLYFGDQNYRVYRHRVTRQLDALPAFEEPVVFLENFERMILLDEKGIPKAVELIEQIVQAPNVFILTVHQLAAEILRLAAPAFNKFGWEVNLTQYEFEAFQRIIEKRMVVSGYKYVFVNEAAFWGKLYQASSGLPGVGLDLFLRCLRVVKDDRVEVNYALPPIRDHFERMSIDSLLLLRRVYMQSYLSFDNIPRNEHQMANALVQIGILVLQKNRLFIRPQFFGAIRDVLHVRNLR